MLDREQRVEIQLGLKEMWRVQEALYAVWGDRLHTFREQMDMEWYEKGSNWFFGERNDEPLAWVEGDLSKRIWVIPEHPEMGFITGEEPTVHRAMTEVENRLRRFYHLGKNTGIDQAYDY